MTLFADASAVVKRYADEEGSTAVRSRGDLVISELTLVEVPAALWRKHRAGELAAEDAAVLVQTFRWDVAQDWAVVRLAPGVLADAALLVARHPLRTGDAIQLAGALAAWRVGACDALLAFDRRLRDAAVREGVPVSP